MRLLLIPLLVAVVALLAAMVFALPPHLSIIHRFATFLSQMSGCACVQIATMGNDRRNEIGELMRARAIIVIAASVLLAACADSDRLRSDLGGPVAASEVQQDPGKQTLASKVLGAMALERVTHRKADPSRLNELH